MARDPVHELIYTYSKRFVDEAYMLARRAIDGKRLEELTNESFAWMICLDGFYTIINMQLMISVLAHHVYFQNDVIKTANGT